MNYKLEYIALHRMDHREPKTSNNKLLDWEKKVVEIRVTAVKMQKNERWYIGIYCGNRNDKNFWVLRYTVETGMTRISEYWDILWKQEWREFLRSVCECWRKELNEKELRSHDRQSTETESGSVVSNSLVTPWTIQSMEFSRPEYWTG